jgi:hypothetical protein
VSERDWLEGLLEGAAEGTGDDPVLCHLCGKDVSVATIADHLVAEHDIDPEAIANAPVIDMTEDE